MKIQNFNDNQKYRDKFFRNSNFSDFLGIKSEINHAAYNLPPINNLD